MQLLRSFWLGWDLLSSARLSVNFPTVCSPGLVACKLEMPEYPQVMQIQRVINMWAFHILAPPCFYLSYCPSCHLSSYLVSHLAGVSFWACRLPWRPTASSGSIPVALLQWNVILNKQEETMFWLKWHHTGISVIYVKKGVGEKSKLSPFHTGQNPH